jgi:hypothetical protein
MNAIANAVETEVTESNMALEELSLDILAMVGGGADGVNML